MGGYLLKMLHWVNLGLKKARLPSWLAGLGWEEAPAAAG
jgi:hypothetical protein